MTGESYKDRDGNPVTLEALCRTEPEWACSKIRHLRARFRRTTKAEAAIIADLREGAAFLKSGWSWGGIDGRTKLAFCQEVVAEVLEAAANRYERGEHRKENEE